MRKKLFAGTTNVTEPIFAQDTTSAVGAGLSGLVFNTSGLVCEYRRQGQSTWTTVTLSAGTLGTPSGSPTLGTIILDGASAGDYELGLPDNAFASGARWCVVRLRGAANMLTVRLFYELDAVNYQDGQRAGLAALPTSGVLAVKPAVTLAAADVSGNLPVDLQTIKSQSVTAAAGVTFPASIGTSVYAGGAVASVTGSVGSVAAGVNATQWGGVNVTGMPLPAATYVVQTGDAYAVLAKYAGLQSTGAVAASPTPSATVFAVALDAATADSAASLIGLYVTFRSGALAQSYRQITGATINATTSVTLTVAAFPGAPAANDLVSISG